MATQLKALDSKTPFDYHSAIDGPSSLSSVDKISASSDEDDDTGKQTSFEEEAKSTSKQPLSTHVSSPSKLKTLFSRKKKAADLDLDSIATQPSVYDDDDFAKFSAPHPKWENLHRFDPNFRWTWRQEQSLIRKMDLRIAAWAVLMFFCLDLDRENISQANADDLLEDLHLTTSDYNLGNTLFKVAFLCAELPSQMISKKVGPDRWVPTQMVVWSIFSGAQFWMKGRSSFLALRFFIGLLQGGFIPDVVLYLSYFYTKKELPLRLAFFWVSNYLVKIVGPFLALGILRLRGTHGHAGWQYLFLIEGILTLVVGLLTFVNMPASPTQTRNWFWKDGWFTVEEEKIIVNRVVRDDPSKASMHNRQGINLRGFKKSLADYDLWPMYIIGLTFLLPTYPLANYLTIQLKDLGFSTTVTNALSIPAPALGLVLLIVVTVVSESVDNRSFVAMSQSVWNFPFFFALYALPADANRWTYWAVASLQQAYPYVHALQVAWVSRQSGSVRTRTISAAIYNMAVQASAIIGANVYQQSDAPRYLKGNLAMGILSLCVCFLYVFTFFYYRWRNSSRDNTWNAMSRDEQLHYLQTTPDEGNRRLDFRFAY
ncbi:hypothetical protein CBS101457_001041 [Exobasidium rhododendri]|nr:hypothetical protein CBS101457_001041 [Exobasidium rhododendri]